MRLIIPAALVIVAGFSLAVMAADPPDDSTGPPTTEQLLERLEKLEELVAALEDERPRRSGPAPRFRMRPPRDGGMQPLPPDFVPPRQRPGEEDVPENWRRFEFNGQDYYIIPVDEVPPNPARRR